MVFCASIHSTLVLARTFGTPWAIVRNCAAVILHLSVLSGLFALIGVRGAFIVMIPLSLICIITCTEIEVSKTSSNLRSCNSLKVLFFELRQVKCRRGGGVFGTVISGDGFLMTLLGGGVLLLRSLHLDIHRSNGVGNGLLNLVYV